MSSLWLQISLHTTNDGSITDTCCKHFHLFQQRSCFGVQQTKQNLPACKRSCQLIQRGFEAPRENSVQETSCYHLHTSPNEKAMCHRAEHEAHMSTGNLWRKKDLLQRHRKPNYTQRGWPKNMLSLFYPEQLVQWQSVMETSLIKIN